ncbi:hypothetical protein RND71_039231 [Anisodus tanguticus]|uniref:Ran-binding protein 10 n=1 Tax=Anisodus tanguticus TaxID=243964 RepID=A0AAE1QW27_9SOLA|nr:hypothetical protein RND71_039231 [Anisodus tanguticus]
MDASLTLFLSQSNSDTQENLIGPYFLNQWRLKSKTLKPDPMEIEQDEELPPNELDTLNSSGGFSIIGPDKLSVNYPNVNLHGHDVGVVQANRPAPSKRLVYYFEMYVKNGGVKGQIAIGFTTPGFKLRRQPGWESNSYGYHGDDGLLYRGQGKGEACPVYSTGDTVGGGINYASQELFFTKNGTVVGTVLKDVKGPLFPTVAVHSQNEEVTVNFGKDPFVFDLKAYEAKERAKQHSTIEKLSIPQNASYGIVRSYLQHYGYEETLRMFDVESQSTLPPISFVQENGFTEDMNTYSLNQRKVLRQLIRNGQIDDAFGKLREWYPQIVQDGASGICFLLHCQNFIELVRVGKLEEAVLYGRTEFGKFYKLGDYDDLVKDCAALLAYEQPQKSSVGYLLGDSQREIVADAVNAMVLSTNPSVKDSRECLHSRLDRLLRQLSASFLEKRSLNGDQGEGFHLHRILNSSRKG